MKMIKRKRKKQTKYTLKKTEEVDGMLTFKGVNNSITLTYNQPQIDR